MFVNYSKNACKFSVAGSTQTNESLNRIISRKAPKNKCLSTGVSADYRVASAVLNKNDGDESLININNNLNLSPGIHTSKFCKRSDLLRYRKAVKSKLISSKFRRNVLRQKRENLRKSKEQIEGTTYKSNCGIQEYSKTNSESVCLNELEEKLNMQCCL